MLRNYLKITARNILKHKGYSAINIMGLATGIACCLLIFIYVKGELTYDHFHENKDNIYRITSKIDFAGSQSVMGASGYPEGQAYKDGIPEILEVVRVNSVGGVIQKGEEYIQQNRILFADPALFTVFSLELLHGAFDGAFDNMNSVVLTRRGAIKYFGETDVVGKVLPINVKKKLEDYYVTAVIENHPSNSSFDFDVVLPWAKHLSQLSDYSKNAWGNIGIGSFLLLMEGADPVEVQEKMQGIRVAQNPEDEFAGGIQSNLQALTDIHLGDIHSGDGLGQSGDPMYAYILSGIALVILVVACINFTNLSMARSLPRAKEIGVRKVLGAQKKQLAFQFLNEALVMCLIAFVLGLIIAELALPGFGNLTERAFEQSVTTDMSLMLMCLGLVLLTALLSGFYPAFVISRLKTVNSLKGRVRLKGNSGISKVLVVVQFTIAAVLVIGTITMNKQMSYMINMDLGYDDTNLIAIDAEGSNVQGIDRLFRASLDQNPNIEGVAADEKYQRFTSTNWEGADQFVACYNEIDQNYFDMMDLEIAKGRPLKSDRDMYIKADGDTLYNIVVNETFAKKLGDGEIIGRQNERFRIVGVVKDYHFQNVKGKIMSLMLRPANPGQKSAMGRIFVKYNPSYLSEVRSVVEEVWNEHVPYRPLDISFVEEANKNSYAEDARWKQIITYATLLAIIISSLGLLGLAHLATQQRIKEIGIRKVLGASLSQIVIMLNSNFAKLVLISVVVAAPLAYYFIDQWLQNFAYPVEVTATLFLFPGVLTFAIAFFTVSIQSVKHAKSNPVNALRCE